jgi:translation initiation factor RLI1
MNPYHRHVIEEPRCVRCGICLATCPVDAVEIVSLGN